MTAPNLHLCGLRFGLWDGLDFGTLGSTWQRDEKHQDHMALERDHSWIISSTDHGNLRVPTPLQKTRPY